METSKRSSTFSSDKQKFLRQLFFFLVPVVIVLFAAEIFFTKTARKSKSLANGEVAIWHSIYSKAIDVDLIINGSSRAWVQFDPEIIEEMTGLSVYNFGIDGHNFWLQNLRHSEYLRFNKKPKVVVLSVDIFTLQKREDLYNRTQFLPFLFLNKTMFEAINSYDGIGFSDFIIPSLRYAGERELIDECFANFVYSDRVQVSAREKGFKAMNQVWNDDFLKAKSKQESYEIKIDSLTLQIFEKYVISCKESGIQLFLVYAPEYYEVNSFVKNKATIVALFKKIAEEQRIHYLDYSLDSICFDKKYFYNSMHLNAYGASIFSNKLGSDLFRVLKTQN